VEGLSVETIATHWNGKLFLLIFKRALS